MHLVGKQKEHAVLIYLACFYDYVPLTGTCLEHLHTQYISVVASFKWRATEQNLVLKRLFYPIQSTVLIYWYLKPFSWSFSSVTT